MADVNMHKYIGEAAFVGVGGCGMNMLACWQKHLAQQACCIAINRNKKRLDGEMVIGHKLLLTAASLSDSHKVFEPVGRNQVESAMQRQMDRLTELLQERQVVFLLAGLGGVTGTWASPLICNHIQSIGKQVVTVLVMPFGFERKRVKLAEEALPCFDGLAHRVLCYNDYLIEHAPEGTSMEDAFDLMNKKAFELLGMSDG